MKTQLSNLTNKKHCLITGKWLIIATTVASCTLQSCVPPKNMATGERLGRDEQIANKSFSGGLVHANKSKKKKSGAISDNIESVENFANHSYENSVDISAFEDKLLKNKNNANNNLSIQNQNFNRTLPSLKEQMEELNQNQTDLEENISDIKDDMQELKDLLKNTNKSISKPVAGQSTTNTNVAETPVLMNVSEGIEEINKEGTFLSSDEEAHSESPKIQPIPSQKPVAEKSKPVAKTQPKAKVAVNKKVEIVADEVKKEEKIDQPVGETKQAAPNKENNIDVKNSPEKDFSDVINKVAKGEFNSAIKSINAKLKETKDPAVLSDCNYWLGECNFKQKNYTKALDYYKYVLAGKGDKKDVAQSKLAECYMRMGKNDEAKNAFQSLLKNYPKSSHTPKAKKMLQQL